ncbi:MAG: hypothetical protein K0M50_10270 [Prolixibacteraceae bacterium]|nr:hypothetical protein [Prolixibacteraceae bacterium]
MKTEMTIIILQIVIGLLTAYLIYYAQQKGKNQADKEDLRKLTEIVEDVKRKNNEEIELLRANLSLLTDREKQIFNEEKQAIVIFFAQLNTWIWDSLNIYIYEYNHSNYQEISSRLIVMRDAYNQTNVAFSKVRLIVTDEEVIKAGHDAIIKTLELHHFKEGLLKRLVSTLSWEKILVDQIVNKEVDFRTMTSDLRDFYQRQAEKHEKDKKEITDEYFAKHNDIFKPALGEVNSFKDKAKVYLRKNK